VALLLFVDGGRGVEAGRMTAVPPHDLEAEEATLGAALLSADALAILLGQLCEDDFYRPAHRGVYAAVSALHGRGDPVDAVTVAGELDRAGALADVGGAPFLHTLVASVPTAANADQYARRVRDLATRAGSSTPATSSSGSAMRPRRTPPWRSSTPAGWSRRSPSGRPTLRAGMVS
jgi:hypothetical protein